MMTKSRIAGATAAALACLLAAQGAPAADADLSVTASGPASPVAGTQITYTITVTNNGPDGAVNVTVTVTLAPDVAYASHTGVGSYDSGTGVWTVGNVANGASEDLTLDADVSSSITAGTTLNTTAAVSSDTPDSNAANDTALDSAVSLATSADLVMWIVAPGEGEGIVGPATVVAGSQYFYVFTVTNNGPSEATGVVVTVTLPAGLSYLSDSTVFGTYDGSTGVWDIGVLGAGVPATLRLVVDVDDLASGSGNIVADVTGSDADPDPGNESDFRALTIDPAPAGGVDCTPGAGNPLSAALAAMLVALALTRRGERLPRP